MNPVGTGALFENQGHRGFMEVTGSRYDAMVVRVRKKKLPPLSFSKDQFRAAVLRALGGHEDGAIQCPYCRKFCVLKEVTPDHETPLSRGGSSGLDNLGFPCMQCNQVKGSLTPEEFHKLLRFLETEIPLGRQDVLSRLAKAVKLAAGAARNRALFAKFGKPGKQETKQDDDGMPPF
jgi:5-methylcytosine-specific restriction endonuclease McrA